MSILSSIKSAASSVKNFFTGSSNNVASAGMAFPGVTSAQLNAVKAAGQLKAGTSSGLQTYQVKGDMAYGTNNNNISTYGPSGPGTIYYNAQGGANPAYNAFISPTATNSPTIMSASTSPMSSSMTADTFDSNNIGTSSPASLTGSASTGASGGSTDSASSTGGSANFPVTPNYKNVGPLNLSGTASVLEGTHTYDPVKGFAPITKGDALDAQRQKDNEALKRMIPEMASPYDNPEVQAATAARDAKQQELNNYTSQLNSVVAKQQQDLLEQKHAIAQEGGTEAGWNGREAEINYQAAVAALPIQALVATAQGNLQLAQTHLTDLTKMVTDRLEKNYQYQRDLFAFAKSNSDSENKIKLDRLEKATDRAVADKRDSLNFAQSLVLKYGDQPDVIKAVSNLMRNPDSPTLGADLLGVAKNVNSGSASSGFTDIIQQALDAGATPEQAAREAATVSENSGIPVDQKTLASMVTQAQSLNTNTANNLISSIRNSLFK